VLRTRLPLVSLYIATQLLPFDLHVLGLPLAFILSQDQTLRCKKFLFIEEQLCWLFC
jgi:hypothetical protein